jgi:hypothetical protein
VTQKKLGLTVKDKVSSLVETANRVPTIASMFRGWDRLIALRVDGEEIGIATSQGQAKVLMNPPHTGGGLWFGLTQRTLDMLMGGRLSLRTAKLSGRLQSAGNTADILRFASIFTACLKQQQTGYSPTSTTSTGRPV